MSSRSSNGDKIPADQQTQLISDQQRTDAVITFLELMLLDSSATYPYTHPKCAMGWLPTMIRLHQQLDKDPLSRRDVRIGTFCLAATIASYGWWIIDSYHTVSSSKLFVSLPSIILTIA